MSSTEAAAYVPQPAPAARSLGQAAVPPAALLMFLLAVRLLLNIPAFVGAQFQAAAESAAASPARADSLQFPGVWVRWDAGFYLGIAREGYQGDKQYLGFFPGYPIVVRLFALGQPALMPWVGVLVSNAAIILASLVLWQQVAADFSPAVAWSAVVTYSLFPSAFFFSAPYSESLFVLFSVLVYVMAARGRLWQAALCVLAASLTRLSGLMLVVIPLAAAWRRQPASARGRLTVWVRLAGIAALSAAGLMLLGIYMSQTFGSPLIYTQTQAELFKRTVAWPWQSLGDSLGVLLVGLGGFQSNWFMRAVSAADLACALLFIAATIGAIRVLRPSLVIYQVVALLFLLASHGPYTLGLYAMQRYVLVLFPGFIVLGIWLNRLPKPLRLAVWTVSAALLVFLTAWFTNGRWVA